MGLPFLASVCMSADLWRALWPWYCVPQVASTVFHKFHDYAQKCRVAGASRSVGSPAHQSRKRKRADKNS